MSDKIEQLLERQNEILERLNSNSEKQRQDIEELVRLTYLVIKSQTWTGRLPEKTREYYNSKIKEHFG